ncbi:MAG: hypothetical protein WA009_08440 [Phototrophicaceae bacterium]|jgi:hypothetical protein|nr:MAG: hypothetical protein UZ13_00743 [Chloroflexi bacterium OLB13]MBV6435828.1 hypothetical protein [Anaerolineae bacterium]GIK27534.1 MAG: hypothetical protein BroJett007_06720 [Chloroflexota bacterium]
MTLERTVVWVHRDDLSPLSPALVSHPDAPAIFVFDDELLREWKISFKRIVFIYECLLELPVTIRRGDSVSEVTDFAAKHGSNRIVTSSSPSPRHAQIVSQIAQRSEGRLSVDIIERTPFVHAPRKLDLRRFTYYWNAVKDNVLGS